MKAKRSSGHKVEGARVTLMPDKTDISLGEVLEGTGSLKRQFEVAGLKFGIELLRIRDFRKYLNHDYKSFGDYVVQELGLPLREANSLINNWKRFVAKNKGQPKG